LAVGRPAGQGPPIPPLLLPLLPPLLPPEEEPEVDPELEPELDPVDPELEPEEDPELDPDVDPELVPDEDPELELPDPEPEPEPLLPPLLEPPLSDPVPASESAAVVPPHPRKPTTKAIVHALRMTAASATAVPRSRARTPGDLGSPQGQGVPPPGKAVALARAPNPPGR
jgi:hypothetical protein